MSRPNLDELVVLARRSRPLPGVLAGVARSLRVPFSALPVAALVMPSGALAAVAAKLGLSRVALLGWGAGSTVAATGVVAALAFSEPDAPPVAPPLPTVQRQQPSAAPVAPPVLTPQASGQAPLAERRVAKDTPPTWGEPELIERARKALLSDPRRALSLAQEHQRRFPNGALGVEREVIALDALARTGQSAEARRRALLFEQKYPKSIHSPRVRALLARLDGER